MRTALASVLLSLLLATGCGRSTRFFSLQPSGEAAAFHGDSPGVSVEVRRVDFPAYLNSPQMVTRGASGEVKLDDKNLWVDDLAGDFQRVFVQDLSSRLKSSSVFVSGTSTRTPDVIVQVDVARFDVDEDRNANLTARWTVSRDDSGLGARSGVAVLEEPHVGSGQAGTVAALSSLVDRLSSQIAAAVPQVHTH